MALVPLVPVIGEPSAPSNSFPVRAKEFAPALVRGLCLSLNILAALSASSIGTSAGMPPGTVTPA